MQKTAAQQAYRRFCKQAAGDMGGYGYDPYAEEQGQNPEEEAMMQQQLMAALQEAQQQDELNAFQDPNYESPLERKRKMQGAGGAIGSGAGLLGGALSGSLIPKSGIGKALGGIGGGVGGMALGGLGGWGLGSLLARARMGQDYPEE